MTKLVTIFGGSGFVGRYIARRMAQAGWRVRVAVRRPNEAIFVKPYGTVGQVEPIGCNIRDDASVAAALSGADAVVNCVGILNEVGRNKFADVQAEGAARIARLATEHGVSNLVHISAIGADENGPSAYALTKAQGEAAIQEHFPNAVILRPSIIFGSEDQFFNRFAQMAASLPVLPISGANSKFQPVYVDDVARAAVAGAMGQGPAGIYELGGPDVETFSELMARMKSVIQRRPLTLSLPKFVAWCVAFGADMAQAITFGLFTNSILTRDQLKQLQNDNVVADDAKTLGDLGIEATSMASILPDYLWCYRPSGQYAAIKDSAKNLKSS